MPPYHRPVRHLALAVSDQARSRRFYETYFGFVPEASLRADGTLLLHDAAGFSLALHEVAEPIVLPPFLHFGTVLPTPDDVRRFRDRIVSDGCTVVDWWDEPDYVSVKLRDPDGYVVEVAWEPAGS